MTNFEKSWRRRERRCSQTVAPTATETTTAVALLLPKSRDRLSIEQWVGVRKRVVNEHQLRGEEGERQLPNDLAFCARMCVVADCKSFFPFEL